MVSKLQDGIAKAKGTPLEHEIPKAKKAAEFKGGGGQAVASRTDNRRDNRQTMRRDSQGGTNKS